MCKNESLHSSSRVVLTGTVVCRPTDGSYLVRPTTYEAYINKFLRQCPYYTLILPVPVPGANP